MDPALHAWRQVLRAERLAARAAVSPGERERIGEAVFARLQAYLGDSARGQTIALYWPIRGELNPLPFAERLIALGGAAALPRVVATDAPLEFRLWTPGAALARGVWDIPYPADGAAVRPDTIVMPLVGFDEAGFRLGYGGGYYDRTLAQLGGGCRTVGVGFESARLPTIHPQPHDAPLDAIITEAGLWARAAEG